MNNTQQQIVSEVLDRQAARLSGLQEELAKAQAKVVELTAAVAAQQALVNTLSEGMAPTEGQ